MWGFWQQHLSHTCCGLHTAHQVREPSQWLQLNAFIFVDTKTNPDGAADLDGQCWGRTPPSGYQLATHLRHSCWSHQEVLRWWASNPKLQKDSSSGCSTLCAPAGFVTSERLCSCMNQWFRSGIGLKCLSLCYWCVQNNQLNIGNCLVLCNNRKNPDW